MSRPDRVDLGGAWIMVAVTVICLVIVWGSR